MEKNPIINLPVEITLTDSGMDHCKVKSIPLREMTNIRGSRVSGFSWSRFNAAVVQKMLISDFVESIEIKRTEYSSSRMDLMDTTKLIVYGIIYRKYIVEVRRLLLASKYAERIRKNHPGVLLPEYNYNTVKIEKYFRDNLSKIEQLKEELSARPLSLIENDEQCDERTRNENRCKIMKLIDIIDVNTWFVIHMILLGDGRDEVINALDDLLLTCLLKTDIAEYISLLTLELLQSAERSQYENIAKKRHLLSEGESINKYLTDQRSRDFISSYAKNNNNIIKLSYHFRWNPDEEKHFKFDISVIYDGILSEKMRLELEEKIRAGDKDFISTLYYAPNDEAIPKNLGLCYFSYINEACRKHNIGFNTRIISDSMRESTEFLMMISL